MSATITPTRFAAEFRAICGPEHVVESPTENICGVIPFLAVTPGSVDEIAAIVRFANEHSLNVVPAGGGTQQHTGSQPPQVDVLLYTARLTEVEHYDPGDLTIGVGAGWTVASVSDKVAADNLFFAGDPALPEHATVGGLLATGLYGPQRHGYGGLRDCCIGVRFITGDGRKAKGGGRVVKNVAGYDMMKLLIGSWGTLGIITSASFKLFPAPRQTRTFVTEFASAAEAVAFRNRMLHSPLDPVCLELASPEAGGLLATSSSWAILLRAAGSDAVLARYRTELGTSLSREVEGQAEHDFWQSVSDFSHSVRNRHPRSLVLSMTLPLADVQPVLNEIAGVANSNGLTHAVVGRVGVGHLQVGMWPASQSEVAQASFVDAICGVRDRLPSDVSMAVLHCPEEARGQISAWAVTPTDLESMRAVKHALDPKDILNRGRFPF